MDQEQEVGREDEEDREDVDHPDSRLDEEHPVETCEGGGGDREEAIWPEAPREQIHHRDAQSAEDACGDSPSEGVEAEVDVIARCALEVRSVPAVTQLAGGDYLLAQGRFRVEVVELAEHRRRLALLDALDVDAVEIRRRLVRDDRRVLRLAAPGPHHRFRLRRLAPPWFCPSRSGRCALISHTTVSASGTGTAIVSSYISRERKMPRRFLI